MHNSPLGISPRNRPIAWNLVVVLIAFVFALGGSGRAVEAQDGRTLLEQTVAAYQHLTSYQGQADVDVLFVDAKGQIVKHVGSATLMKYEKPNKLYIYCSTTSGSRYIYSDGAQLSVYDATPKQYTIGPTERTLISMLPLLYQRASVAAGLDPLFFLSENTLPPELTDLQFKGTDVFNGHPVYIVTGVTHPRPGPGGPLPSSSWTWWIDRRSHLLEKIETKTPNVRQGVVLGQANHKKVVVMTGTLILRHTVTNIKPDTVLAANTFRFAAPKDAHERKATSELLKGR